MRGDDNIILLISNVIFLLSVQEGLFFYFFHFFLFYGFCAILILTAGLEIVYKCVFVFFIGHCAFSLNIKSIKYFSKISYSKRSVSFCHVLFYIYFVWHRSYLNNNCVFTLLFSLSN